jgi:hypothetical protein
MAEKVTVQSGQTLSSIAKANNTTVQAIKDANPVLTTNAKYQGGNVIFSGTKLNLPGTTTGAATGAVTPGAGGAVIPPEVPIVQQGISAEDLQKAIAQALAGQATMFQQQISGLTSQISSLTQKQTDDRRAATTTALEDFKANLNLAGLGTLATTIDEYIKQDLTASQIKINLLGTAAYKERFPGMKALSDAGKAVNEATYISMERGMVSVLKAYGLDDKTFGTTEKLGTIIANQVSVTEFENRVQMATDRVKKNTDVLASLNQYYGVDLAGAVSYLLDPKTGMDVVKKQIRASELGAAANMYNFNLSQTEAESYINVSGTSDLNALKESFGKARVLADTQQRLSQIEGSKYNELEAVATTLGQDQLRQLESQRRALREQARFAGQSGISSSSLKTESTI